MKMKYAIAAAAAAACLASAGANAATKSPAYDAAANSDSGVYVGLNTGMSFLHEAGDDTEGSNYNTGFNVGGFAGYKFTKNWRTDLSLDYTHNSVKAPSKAVVKQVHVLVNGYFDYPIQQFTPYIGLGIGYNHLSQHSSSSVEQEVIKSVGLDSVNGVGWQVTTGVKYSINQDFDLGLSYRLVASNGNGKVEGASMPMSTVLNNIIGINATYNF